MQGPYTYDIFPPQNPLLVVSRTSLNKTKSRHSPAWGQSLAAAGPTVAENIMHIGIWSVNVRSLGRKNLIYAIDL